jgi:hypothetical protein
MEMLKAPLGVLHYRGDSAGFDKRERTLLDDGMDCISMRIIHRYP